MGKLHPYPPRQFTRQPTLTGGPKETLAPPPSRCPAVALSPPAPAQCSRHKPSPLLLAPKSRPPPPVRRPNGAVHVGLLLLPQRGHLRHLRHLPHRSAVPGEEASAPGRGQGAACGLRVLRGDRRREGARRGGRDLRVVVPRLQPSLPRAARRRGRGDRVLLRPRGADAVGARGGGAQWSLPLRRVLPHPPCSTPPHLTTTPPPSPPPLAQANLRILVTSGAGFIGSHLIDKLMENEKHEVIVADNFFTGSKDNLKKWIGHPRFELIRHDVTQPLLVEVDQIYHLACPASPIFYKHNPVKGMRFVDLDDEECYERFRRRERRGLVARDYTEVYASMPGSYGRAVVEPYSCELRLVLCGIVLVI